VQQWDEESLFHFLFRLKPFLAVLAQGLKLSHANSSAAVLDKNHAFSLFKSRLEEQAGKVYEVRDLDDAARTLANVLMGQGVKSAVLAKMPPEIREKVVRSLWSSAINIVEPHGRDAPRIISKADAGVTVANFAVADIGAIVEITYDDADRLVSALPKIHVCLLQRDQILERFEEAGCRLRNTAEISERCVVSFISGPSRTGDIELKLVLGVHGPHQVHVIVFGGG